jgi:ssDNA-binding Zn-finger/Zn-ribbon topoisomerase 1
MSVKALTETDRAIKKVEGIDAICPKCGDPKVLYAHRIVSVSCEIPKVQAE